MNSQFASTAYVINAPDVVAENFDGQVVILNLANGHYFSLGGIAGEIWRLVMDGVGLSSIGESVAAQRSELHAGAVAFLQRLVDLGLIRAEQLLPAAMVPDGLEWGTGAPELETYDDLAELIFADPIHDVDEEAGWPAPRSPQ
jgi:hypothetical protein